jgi:hypothetical protein
VYYSPNHQSSSPHNESFDRVDHDDDEKIESSSDRFAVAKNTIQNSLLVVSNDDRSSLKKPTRTNSDSSDKEDNDNKINDINKINLSLAQLAVTIQKAREQAMAA